MAENKLPRFRTIKQCLVEIKRMDEGSQLSEWFIRSLCRNHRVQYIASGNKSLVNFDNLLAYLCGDQGENDEEE